ncbi:MAG: 3D domain-containing protein [Gemmatimonadaceae bacterium]|nr:3D domain-containing protein [Gemmatimonadaceae bacterium]
MTKKPGLRRDYALRIANGARPSRRGEYVRLLIAGVVAIAFIVTGAAHLPMNAADRSEIPVPVGALPRLEPVIVRAAHTVPTTVRSIRRGSFVPALASAFRATAREAMAMRDGLMPRMPGKFAPAEVGEVVSISLTQYCNHGETRRGRIARQGIVAADPRIFPLARYVEVFLGDKYLGRYLVDDTGGNVLGATLDLWTPSCSEAVRFGRRSGKAILVASGDENAPPPAEPIRWDGIAKR